VIEEARILWEGNKNRALEVYIPNCKQTICVFVIQLVVNHKLEMK
jgi:hypothetical protein